MNTRWQLQEAKAKFSQLVKAAEKAPQEITVHGRPTAVLMSMSEYERMASANDSSDISKPGTMGAFWELARKGELFEDEELEFPRDKSPVREISFDQ